jgi:16S rRNA (cytosine967-C5)-methyltransferase
MPSPPDLSSSHPPGLACRLVAAEVLEGVLRRRRSLDQQLDGTRAHPGLRELIDRDRALARRIVTTTLRRLGTLRTLIADALDKGLPDAPRIESALLTGAAQLLFLDIPDHAAVDLSVRLVQLDRRDARYAGLVNAVLRRLARAGAERLSRLDSLKLDTPDWLRARWGRAHGGSTTRAIALANSFEPPLDLTVKSDPDGWAERLGGRKLPTGSVRLASPGALSTLPGYTEGSWWV